MTCNVGIGTERRMQASKADQHPPHTHSTGDTAPADSIAVQIHVSRLAEHADAEAMDQTYSATMYQSTVTVWDACAACAAAVVRARAESAVLGSTKAMWVLVRQQPACTDVDMSHNQNLGC
jgi:hypothetical protein